MYLSNLLKIDAIAGRPARHPPAASTTPSAAELPDVIWQCLGSLDAPGAQRALLAASREVVSQDASVSEFLNAAARVHNYEQAFDADLTWLHGRLVRGLAFAVAPSRDSRFEDYAAYCADIGVSIEFDAFMRERHAQALLMSGRHRAAVAVLDAAMEEVPMSLEPQLQLLRAQARLHRVAGDPDNGKPYSDMACGLVKGVADGAIGAGAVAGVWVNRAALLVDLDEHAQAYEAARLAHDWYSKASIYRVGRTEADAYQCLTDPDKERRASLARRILEEDSVTKLASPARAMALEKAAQALEEMEPDLAAEAYRRSIASAQRSRRVAVTTRLNFARFLMASRREAPAHVDTLVAEACEIAMEREHQVLAGQALLLRVQTLKARGRPEKAAHAGSRALDALGETLPHLTAGGARHVLHSLRTDLIALFDIAVDLKRHELALRVAEIARSARLNAMFRADYDALPPEIRDVLGEVTSAAAASQGDDDRSPESPNTRQHRAIARDELEDAQDRLAETTSRVFAALSAKAPLPLERFRNAFPTVDVMVLAQHDGFLRWTYWPSGHPTPSGSGRELLSDQELWQLARLAAGDDDLRGETDSVSALGKLIPDPLAARLDADAVDDLLVVPTGDLWHVPWNALPMRTTTSALLCERTRVTVIPSLTMATELAAAANGHEPAERPTVAGYFNPDLPGASAERTAVEASWEEPHRLMLDTVKEIGRVKCRLAVASTHADDAPGLWQSLTDHLDNQLTAANCLTRDFPPHVVLGSCNGFHGTHAKYGQDEPIGLLTAIGSKGAVWIVGGHQLVADLTTGWILRDTYKLLAAGRHFLDALRESQLAYLAAARHPALAPQELAQIFDSEPDLDPLHPRSWALTAFGPPHPSTWSPPNAMDRDE